MRTYKRLTLVVLMALAQLLTACSSGADGAGGDSYDENQVYTPQAFYDLYKEGYSSQERKHPALDGKKVTIEGKIEKVVNTERNNKTGIAFDFVKLGGDGMFEDYAVNALFSGEQEEKVRPMNIGDMVKFQANIIEYNSLTKTVILEDAVLK